MKTKTIIGAWLVVAALAGTLGCTEDERTDKVVADSNNVSAEYVSTSQYNEMLAAKNATEDTLYKTINEIDNGLNAIREDQGLLTEANAEKFSKKEEILRTIRDISSLMEQNKEKIKKLNGQLASLRSQRSKMKTENEELKQFITQKEEEMVGLQSLMTDQTTTINYLNQVVSDLKLANNAVTETNRKMDTQLHKAYFAMGSYKELKAHNVVERNGGLLGLGSTKEMKDDFDQQYFTEIDIRQVKTIPVGSKKAKLVTHHPVGSYEWEKGPDGKGNTEALTIKDPEKFWAASKYLVVEVR